MSQIKYLLRRIVGLNIKQMLKKASEIRTKSGKPRIFILADMAWCGIRYQAGYMDYALFEMYEMNRAQRASILTRGKNNRYVSALNSRSGWPYFESKIIFLKTFSNYIGRRWIDLSHANFEAFKDFAAELGRFIAKPPDGTHGDGVELVSAPASHAPSEENGLSADAERSEEEAPSGADDNDDALLELYNRLKNNGQTLCEEVIVQHEGLSSIYSGSVNTIRTVTILNRGEAHVVAAYLRIGNAGRVVDNFNNGGMVVPVDAATGRISVPAADKAGNVYDVHPVSGTPIVGAQIPLWPECLALVKSAAQVMPMVRYVGWDIAVTPNGPILIEGNQFPGHDIYGLPAQTPDRIGILPAFEAVVPLKSLKHL